MKDKHGWPLAIGNDVMTPEGIGRIASFPVNQTVHVRPYKPGSVIVTTRGKEWESHEVELLGDSLQKKLREERQCQ